jgi:hypothetical protein
MARRAPDNDRVLRARMAAYALHAQISDPTKHTAPARAAFLSRFEREVDPDGVLDPEERARRAESQKGRISSGLPLLPGRREPKESEARKRLLRTRAVSYDAASFEPGTPACGAGMVSLSSSSRRQATTARIYEVGATGNNRSGSDNKVVDRRSIQHWCCNRSKRAARHRLRHSARSKACSVASPGRCCGSRRAPVAKNLLGSVTKWRSASVLHCTGSTAW